LSPEASYAPCWAPRAGGRWRGEGFDGDLAGTWTLSGTTVRLQHAADTFLRDMPLTVAGNQLTGDATFSGVRVRLVLQRP